MSEKHTIRDDVATALWLDAMKARQAYEADRSAQRREELAACLDAFGQYFTGQRVVQ